jgi:uncharacterized membrane protein YesL
MLPADDAPPIGLSASSYLGHSARVLWSDLGTLVPATLGALVIATPWLAVVSLSVEPLGPLTCALFGAPAWTGLVAVAARAVRGEDAGPRVMLGVVRRQYWRAVTLGAATAGFGWTFERAIAMTAEGGAVLIPVLAGACAATFVVLAIDVYAFALLVLHDLPLRATFRAGLALAVAAPGATLGLLAAGVLAYVGLARLGPGTLLLSLPVLAVLHVNNTLLQAERLQLATEETQHVDDRRA